MKKSFFVSAAVASFVLLGAGCSADTTVKTQADVAAPAADIAVGTKIYSAWKGGNHWYSGTITQSGATYAIAYDDGDKEVDVPLTRILKQDAAHPVSVKVGDKLVSKWSDGQWYNATVSAVAGTKISVTYYDGFKQDTELANIFLVK